MNTNPTITVDIACLMEVIKMSPDRHSLVPLKQPELSVSYYLWVGQKFKTDVHKYSQVESVFVVGYCFIKEICLACGI